MTKNLWKRGENDDLKNSYRAELPRSPYEPAGPGKDPKGTRAQLEKSEK